MALTSTGYEIPSLRDVIISLETTARTEYGPTIDTSADSALGHFIATIAIEISELYQDVKSLYDSLDVNTAEQKLLDKLVFLNNLIRKPATYSTAMVQFTGTVGATVPEATILSIGNSTVGRFITDTEVVLDSVGEATVSVTCLTEGPVPVNANTIDTLVDSLPLITAVINPVDGGLGTEIETDSQLLERYFQSYSLSGDSTLASVQAKLLTIAGVTEVKVFENDTSAAVDRGDGTLRPPKSVECIVEGGSEDQIASVIQELKPAGIQYYGTSTVDVKSGSPRYIQFTRASNIPLYVQVTPLIYDEESLSSDYIEQIRSNMLTFASTEYTLGKDVLPQRLLSAVIGISGLAGALITVSLDGITYTTDSLSVSDFQQATLSSDNITIV
mgnify:CR=1 FL=1